MKREFKVIGLRVEKYLKQTCRGHNCDFEYGEEIADKHILLLLDKEEDKRYELELYEEEGECYSGWTTASWGYSKINETCKFNGYTHKPIKDVYIELTITKDNNIDDCNYNGVFEFSYDGGDSYYPCGYYHINMDLFRANARAKDRMPVWVFTGDSGVGKSYIASQLKDLIVFETDSVEELPNEIIANVIVLGNKYNYTLEDIYPRIPYEYEMHVVNFN